MAVARPQPAEDDYTENNPYVFSIMTLNMSGTGKKGGGTAAERQKAIHYILQVANMDTSPHKPDIIFAQEIGAPKTKTWKIMDNSYKYKAAGETKPPGIMWHDTVFTEITKPAINAGYIQRLADSLKFDESKIPIRRMCAALLQHKSKTFTVLAVSWHGPNNRIKDDAKLQQFQSMQKFIVQLKEKIESDGVAITGVLIGGDFNLNFKPARGDLKNNLEEDFDFHLYQMSERRKQEQKKLIDQFLYTQNTIDLDVPQTFNLSDQFQKLKVKDEDGCKLYSTNPDILKLDHDPVLAKVTIL